MPVDGYARPRTIYTPRVPGPYDGRYTLRTSSANSGDVFVPRVPTPEPLAPWEEELLLHVAPQPEVVSSNLTTSQEGEEMPTTGIAEPITVSVPLDLQARRTLFDLMEMQYNLPNQYQDDWNVGRDEFMQHGSPIDISFRPKNDLIPAVKRSTPFGMIKVERVSIKLAKKLIKVAQGGRLAFRPDPSTRDKYVVTPVLDIEREAFHTQMSNGRVSIRTTVSGASEVLINDINTRIQEYRDWRRLYMREHFRTIFGQRSGRIPSASTPTSRELNSNADVPEAQWSKFDSFLKGFQSRLQVTENPFDDIEILPNKTLSSRYWGIEIEAVDIGGVETPKYWVLHGDGSLRSIERPREGSTHEATCASLAQPYCDCGNCTTNPCDCGFDSQRDIQTETGEWNSPILRSFHSRGLKHITDAIEHRETNTTAGIHVHVAAADLTPEQTTQVGLIYTLLEPLFQNEYRRGGVRRFCESVTAAEMIYRFKKMGRAKTLGQKATQVSFGSRYWTVNMAALAKQGTIEFRAMGPRYNYEFLIRWASFLRELVNLAKAGVTMKDLRNVRNFRDVISVFAKFGQETPTPAWSESGAVKSITLSEENRMAPNVLLDSGIGMGTIFDGYNRREPLLATDRRSGDRELVSVRL